MGAKSACVAWLLLLLLSVVRCSSCSLQLLVQNLVDLLRSHADRFVARLHQALHLRCQDDVLGLVQFDRVFRLNESPVDALEHALLNGLLLAFKRADQILHVSLDEEDFTFLLLALGIELQHLDQTLAGFFNDRNLEMLREELHKNVKVAEDIIDVACNFAFSCLNNLIKAAEQVMIDIKKQLDAPLLLVCQHRLDQLVRFVDDFELAKFSERELLGLHEGLNHNDCVLIQVRMVDLVEIRDQLKHTFLRCRLRLLLLFDLRILVGL